MFVFYKHGDFLYQMNCENPSRKALFNENTSVKIYSPQKNVSSSNYIFQLYVFRHPNFLCLQEQTYRNCRQKAPYWERTKRKSHPTV
jgi:hypothetical protein